MGVELLVFGEERALRTEGMEGDAVMGALLDLEGEVNRVNWEGFEKVNPSAPAVLDFLEGELKMEGSTFSESSSSNTEGARRLPVDGFRLACLSGDVKSGEIAVGVAFSI
jgi:hypothetical protein